MPKRVVVTQEEYTGLSSDELNARYHLDGWPCTHEPPHGVNLPKEGKFVRTRHFPAINTNPRGGQVPR